MSSEKLLNEPMRKIVCDVLDSQRNDPGFIQKYERLEKELADPKRVIDICIHESGHLIYWRRAGVPDIKLFGPTVYFDARLNGFNHFAASVRPDMRNVANWIPIVKGAVAGAVFSRVIAKNQKYFGDIGDRKTLEQLLSPARLELLNLKLDDIWNEGERLIEHDLATMDANFRLEVEQTVLEIGRKCFDIDIEWSFPVLEFNAELGFFI